MVDTPNIAEKDDKKKSFRPPAPRKYRYAFGLSRERQKAIMTVVAVLVVLTFVLGFGVALPGLFGETSDGEELGKIGGAKVTNVDLEHSERDAYVHLRLGVGISPDDTPDFQTIQRKTAWRRLASLQYAKKLGITISNSEVEQAIKRQFTDRAGIFDQQAYAMFMTRQLAEYRIAREDFVAYIRSAMILSKLEQVIGSSALVSPFRISREMTRLTDSFVINCIDIPAARVDDDAKVTEAEARDFYDKNRKLFTVPDRVRVKYVVFPASNFLAAASSAAYGRALEHYSANPENYKADSNAVSAVKSFDDVRQEILDDLAMQAATNYYDEHLGDYAVRGTNDAVTLRPFAEVRNQISGILLREEARALSEETAVAFSQMMNPGRDKAIVPIEKAAALTNVQVRTSAYFGRYEAVVGMDVPPAFNREAFNLVPNDPYDHFANPITNATASYVISLADKVLSHVPEFDVASAKAYELAREEKKRTALAKKADDIRGRILTGIKEGKTFSAAAKEQNLATVSAGPFTWLDRPTNFNVSVSLMRSITLRKTGELTEPVPTTNGVMLAYIASRVQGSPTMDISLDLAQSLREDAVRKTFSDWQRRLVAFEPLVASNLAALATEQGLTNSADGSTMQRQEF